jgi:hypothetical protein
LRLSELSCIGEDKHFREKNVPAKRQFSNDRLACVGGWLSIPLKILLNFFFN